VIAAGRGACVRDRDVAPAPLAPLPGLLGRGAPIGWRARSVVGSLEATLSGLALEPALGLDEPGAAIGGRRRPRRRAGG